MKLLAAPVSLHTLSKRVGVDSLRVNIYGIYDRSNTYNDSLGWVILSRGLTSSVAIRESNNWVDLGSSEELLGIYGQVGNVVCGSDAESSP